MENRAEAAKQFVKVTLSVVTMMILLLATRKMEILTDCIVQNMKNGNPSSEPIVAPNCKVLKINVTIPLTMQLCDQDLSLYINNVFMEKYTSLETWVWPVSGKCHHVPSDTLLCTSKNGSANIIVNGFKLSEYETKMLYIFVDTHIG